MTETMKTCCAGRFPIGLPVEVQVTFTKGYSFQWQMTGERNNVRAPTLKLALASGINPVSGGKPVQSTLTESARSDLREPIAGSVRLRPTPPPERSADAMTCVAGCANRRPASVPGAQQAPRHPAA